MPLVSAGEFPAGHPARLDIPGEMIVQIDKARKDQRVRDPYRSCGNGDGGRRPDGVDLLAADCERTVSQEAGRREHSACDREIQRPGLAGESRAGQQNRRTSSGEAKAPSSVSPCQRVLILLLLQSKTRVNRERLPSG
jgi:hypothetical protein